MTKLYPNTESIVRLIVIVQAMCLTLHTAQSDTVSWQSVYNLKYVNVFIIYLPRWWKISVCVQSLVHVSTGYSQVDKIDIDEVIYNAPVSPRDLINMTQWELVFLCRYSCREEDIMHAFASAVYWRWSCRMNCSLWSWEFPDIVHQKLWSLIQV